MNTNAFSQSMEEFISNPSQMQHVVYNALKNVKDGNYDVMDPSNPFAFLMEASLVTSAAGINRSQTLMRKLYPSLAQSYSDLYHHMSDADLSNRFSSPGSAPFVLLLSYDEILREAIEIPGSRGIRKITIPRDTEFKVEGYPFTLEYPIDIRVMPHGTLQVNYDTSELHPLSTLESNIVEHEIVRMQGVIEGGNEDAIVRLDIPVKQFKIKTHKDQLNPSSGFDKRYTFEDQFYYARVWVSSNTTSEWEEIHTTHSDQVFDSSKPTALLQVDESSCRVYIPMIYFNQNMLGRGIRVDIYTSRGAINVDLSEYAPTAISAVWTDLKRHPGPYIEPIRSFATMTMFVNGVASGGSDAMDFEALRERVIHNALGPIITPITSNQLTSMMDNLGYNIVKDVDNITSRTYLASKEMDLPNTNVAISSPIGCSMLTLQDSMDHLVTLDTVADNGNRITIKAGTLFELKDERLHIVSNDVYRTFLNSEPEQLATRFANGTYVYSPFYNVLDTNNNSFEMRSYYLENPYIRSKEYMESNDTLQLEASILRYAIERFEDGYRLVVTTRSNMAFQALRDNQVHCTLAFIPTNERDRAYMNGTLLGRNDEDEYVFEFLITTQFDVDVNDSLQVHSFTMYNTTQRTVGLPLDVSFDIFISVSDYFVGGQVRSDIDGLISAHVLPDESYGLMYELLNCHLGDALTNLWSRARSIASSVNYKLHDVDVYEVWESDQYLEDPDTGFTKIEIDEDGLARAVVEFKAGDPVIGADGEPIVRFHAGSPVIEDGQPVIIQSRSMHRQIDLLVLEGTFRFVNDTSAVRYRMQSIQTIVERIVKDIRDVSKRLLENTQLWYYPQTTLGRVDVTVEDGVRTSISADQSFNVRYYMEQTTYNNVELRESLSRTAIAIIARQLQSDQISTMNIASEIRSAVGGDILDVVVSGLGGFDNNYTMLTINDPTAALNIRKRMNVLANNNISIGDDITIEFIRHR